MRGKKVKAALCGISIGFINALFGAGGGMIAVPALKSMGYEQHKAQENAIAVIFPITLLSAAMYLWKDYVNISDSLIYIPTGLIGAVIGTLIMKKISPKILKKIFALFMIYAGIRLIAR